VGDGRRTVGAAGLAAAALALLAALAPAARAITDSPWGPYDGETVVFPTDPSSNLAPIACSPTAGGPTLLFSDDPETVPGPGILYQDTVEGPVRILLHHVNGSAAPLHFGILMTNPSRLPDTVYLERLGVAGPGTDPLSVGKQAEHLWFEPYRTYVYDLEPHQSWFLDGAFADVAVPPGQAVAALVDLFSTGPLVVTLVAQPTPALSLAGLRVLPNLSVGHGPGGPTPMRGSFRDADLTCTLRARVPADGLADVALGTPEQYLVGKSVVDGRTPAVDAGNYGVLYHLHLVLTVDPSNPFSAFDLFLHAHDNVFAGVAALAGTGGLASGIVPLPVDQPAVSSATQAVMLGMVRLYPLEPTTLDLRWMPAPGSALPVDLLLYPLD
jgi:hypothetical protein